jgi:hypothetical protein
MNRRAFLRSFGALAAAAVAGPALAKLAPTDIDRLMAAMRTGLVEDQTFVFHSPIEIAFDNLTIQRCKFYFRFDEYLDDAVITVNAKNLYMRDCLIDSGPTGAAIGIRVMPQDEDMSTTIQSAVANAFAPKW